MTIPNNLRNSWQRQLRGYGLFISAEEMNVNYRTIYRALKTGKCTQKVFNKINDFLLTKKEEVVVKANQVINQE